MSAPHIPQKAPIPVLVEAGKTYYWCSCGHSKTQPFCDGAHKATKDESPAELYWYNGTVYFCACKHSQKGALCDGSHKAL